jgi:hypothetical protein
LTAAAVALGAVAVETLGAGPAQASAGNPVLQSTDNGGNTKRTGVFTTGNNEWGVLADPNTSGKGSLGVYGHGQDFGVYADTAGTGTGVYGTGGSDAGTGVSGIGGDGGGTGVIGVGTGIAAVGVSGTGGDDTGGNSGGFGVSGSGGTGNGTGVFGSGGSDNGFGVTGVGTGTGTGVYGGGGGDGGTGVYGAGTGTGPGVIGTAPGAGSGVLAENTGTGPALTVSGRAVFSTAGILTVSAGESSVTKTGVTLTGSSLLFATLQQNRSGVWVQSAVPDAAGSSFTVHLNKAVAASTTVAWFTIN